VTRGRRAAVLGLLLAACAFEVRPAAKKSHAKGIDPEQYLADVRYLASEELNGRESGTPEFEKAARFFAREFRRAGLEPVRGHSYYQSFDVTVNARLEAGNRLRSTTGSTVKDWTLNSDFLPLSYSGSGEVRGGIVFAGYGITAPEYGYDDYANLDAQGRIVLLLRHEPQEYDSQSLFEGRIYTEHSQLDAKAENARRHGALAVLIVNDTAAHSGFDTLDKFTGFTAPGSPGLPVVQVKAEVAEEWFRAAGQDFRGVQQGIDADLHPRSFAFPSDVSAEVEVHVSGDQRTVHNIAGYLPGETSEYLIIGAHYDHLGMGDQFSLAGDGPGHLHPGADDNASGAAGVLALARWFAGQPRMKRGILFLAFGAEEIGLVGSGYYIRHPLLPPRDAAAMINMDMIGRVRDGQVIVGGERTGSTFAALLREAQKRSELKLDTEDRVVYGSSDHTSFLSLQMPVLFFFSGLHPDYHRPSDTWDKIDAPATAKLLELVADVGGVLASAPGRPEFVPHRVPAGVASPANSPP
jgi:hypothetical protein